MKDGEKFLPKPIKALGSTSLHLTSSASEGARRLKLEGLSKNGRNVLCRFCGGECVSIQEVIERTEISYTKPEPNAKNGIRTEIAEQKQQEVYKTERITQQCQPV